MTDPTMTDEQARDLGRRWLATGYRWAPGALDVDSERRIDHICDCGEPVWIVLHELADKGYCGHHAAWGSTMGRTDDAPDPRDPATLGTLIAQVRERWGAVAHALVQDRRTLEAEHRMIAHCSPMIPGAWAWVCYVYAGPDLREPSHRFTARTEAEAWTAALEAAPKP